MRPYRFLAAISVAMFLVHPAVAMTGLGYGTHEISLTLQSGEEMAYLINMGAGDRLEVALSVASGGRVDFYLTNMTAYRLYSSSQFDSLYYLAGQSCVDCSGIRYSYDSFVANEYVLIIDNTARTEGGAAPAGPVTVSGTVALERSIWTVQNMAVTAAVVAGIVLFMAYLRWPRKRP